MSDLSHEWSRIAKALRQSAGASCYERLYIAQQALAWASDPGGFRSPYDMIMDVQTEPAKGTPEDLGDYSAPDHQPQS